MVKFSHTIFAMPFAFVGFFLGAKTFKPDFSGNTFLILAMVAADMVFARNAAMGFNRYLDRNIDAKNPRTAIREIPSGKVSEKHALLFVIINSILFIATTYFINRLVFFLSPVALLVVLGYSYTKRYTWLCHLVLGLGLSLAPIGAYLAIVGSFALLPLLFSFTVLFWTAGFDIIYALQDEEFDKNNKLKSIPVLLGTKNALRLSSLFHVLSAGFIIFAGFLGKAELGVWYWGGAVFFISLLIYQHLLVKPNDLSKVNLAFFTTNGIASLVFACFTVFSMFF